MAFAAATGCDEVLVPKLEYKYPQERILDEESQAEIRHILNQKNLPFSKKLNQFTDVYLDARLRFLPKVWRRLAKKYISFLRPEFLEFNTDTETLVSSYQIQLPIELIKTDVVFIFLIHEWEILAILSDKQAKKILKLLKTAMLDETHKIVVSNMLITRNLSQEDYVKLQHKCRRYSVRECTNSCVRNIFSNPLVISPLCACVGGLIIQCFQ